MPYYILYSIPHNKYQLYKIKSCDYEYPAGIINNRSLSYQTIESTLWELSIVMNTNFSLRISLRHKYAAKDIQVRNQERGVKYVCIHT